MAQKGKQPKRRGTQSGSRPRNEARASGGRSQKQADRSALIIKSHERLTRKLAERMHHQEVVSYLSQIALASADYSLFMDEAAMYLARTLDMEFSKILEIDEGGMYVLKAGFGWKSGMRVDKTRFTASECLGGITMRSKRPQVFTNAEPGSPCTTVEHLRRHKVASGASVVIPGVRKPYGVLGVFSRTARDFTEDDLNFIQSVANVIALTFERRTAESELRRFQYMADNANIGISLIDKDGNIRYANKITYERLGFAREEYMRKKVVHSGENGDKPNFKRLFDSVHKQPMAPIETIEMKKDGRNSIPLEINLTGVTFEGEKYLFAVSQDISDRIKSRRNLEFLAESTLALGTSLDYNETLTSVSKLAVAYMGDWCAVDMLDDDGSLRRVSVHHKDPKKVEWAWKIAKEYPVDLDAKTGMANVLRTGKPELYPTITDEMLVAAAKDPKHLKLMRDIGFTSVMTVPIKAGKKAIGAISFITTETSRHFDKSDLTIAMELANRASLAIENARLYSEIEKQKTRLDNIIANIPGIVWEHWLVEEPSRQRVNFASDYMLNMTGYTKDEWRSRGFWDLMIVPEDIERIRSDFRALGSGASDFVQRFRIRHKNGRVIWVESHASVIKGRDGRPLGARGVMMDVSERLELEKRKDEFISMASHELKTPVTTLKVFTQILKKQAEKAGNEASGTYLSKMDRQIERLTDLINDLLDLSRIQTGKLSFKMSSFRIDDLVKDVVEQLQASAEKHRIAVSGRTTRAVSGDHDRLGQVFINLISNAIKYSPNSDRIRVHISEDAGSVSVSVEDFGIGIPKDQQKRIFERFYQITEGAQKTFPGLGIGLFISDEIVRRHGGRISVVSTPGKGSLFKVSLPVKAAKREKAGSKLGARP